MSPMSIHSHPSEVCAPFCLLMWAFKGDFPLTRENKDLGVGERHFTW